MAAFANNKDMTELLIELGADVNAKDNGTRVPAIYEAAAQGYDYVVKLLLAAGAVVNAKGGKLGSILSATMENGHRTCARYLRQAGAA